MPTEVETSLVIVDMLKKNFWILSFKWNLLREEEKEGERTDEM